MLLTRKQKGLIAALIVFVIGVITAVVIFNVRIAINENNAKKQVVNTSNVDDRLSTGLQDTDIDINNFKWKDIEVSGVGSEIVVLKNAYIYEKPHVISEQITQVNKDEHFVLVSGCVDEEGNYLDFYKIKYSDTMEGYISSYAVDIYVPDGSILFYITDEDGTTQECYVAPEDLEEFCALNGLDINEYRDDIVQEKKHKEDIYDENTIVIDEDLEFEADGTLG